VPNPHRAALICIGTWSTDLGKLLKEQNAALDAVIDSAGGDILSQTSRLLKSGGRLVVYGMYVISHSVGLFSRLIFCQGLRLPR